MEITPLMLAHCCNMTYDDEPCEWRTIVQFIKWSSNTTSLEKDILLVDKHPLCPFQRILNKNLVCEKVKEKDWIKVLTAVRKGEPYES